VAHELAKNLRVCFMQLLAVSTFIFTAHDRPDVRYSQFLAQKS
jgi:hypothetical protein